MDKKEKDTAYLEDNTLILASFWKFKKGNNLEWKNPFIDDCGWKSFKVINGKQHYKDQDFEGYSWYRQTIVIPSVLKKYSYFKDAAKVIIGATMDKYKTYLNGKCIEKYNRTEKLYFPKYPKPLRPTYMVPLNENYINWDRENVIAVRLYNYHNKIRPGIMGRGKISVADFYDHVKFRRLESMPVRTESGKPINIKFESTNSSKRNIKATLEVKILHKDSQKVAYQIIEEVIIKKGQVNCFKYSFIPVDVDNYLLIYKIKEKQSDKSISRQQLFAYVEPAKKGKKRIIKPEVPNKVKNKFIPVAYEKQHLNGILGRWISLNIEKGIWRYLKEDEVKLMEGFYARPGRGAYQGEFWGKYMQAAAKMWLYSGNEKIKKQMDRTVDIVVTSQMEDGYSGTYIPEYRWKSWDIWVHKYVLYGLVSYYSLTGYEPAIEAAKKIGNYFCSNVGIKGKKVNIITGPHGGMASTSILDPMVLLYKYTGDERYLKFCNMIIRAYEQPQGPKIISSLLERGRLDKVSTGKAYELLSNLWGVIRLYQITGEERYIKAVIKGWEDARNNRLYITGSGTEQEYFVDYMTLGDIETWPAEGCVTAHWFHLNTSLFYLTGDLKYVEELEKTTYNHLLASMNPHAGGMCYFCPLQNKKPYSIGLCCCNASLPRAIAMIPEIVWAKFMDGGLAILIYNPGILEDIIKTSNGEDLLLRLEVQSEYPKNGIINIKVNPGKPAKFLLAFRVPRWTANFKVIIDNKEYIGKPGEYLKVDRYWRKNDKLIITMNMTEQLINADKEFPEYYAFKRGPQVLAFDSTINNLVDIDQIKFRPDTNIKLYDASHKLPENWIGDQAYTTPSLKTPEGKDILLVPFADASQNGGKMRIWMKIIKAQSLK